MEHIIRQHGGLGLAIQLWNTYYDGCTYEKIYSSLFFSPCKFSQGAQYFSVLSNFSGLKTGNSLRGQKLKNMLPGVVVRGTIYGFLPW